MEKKRLSDLLHDLSQPLCASVINLKVLASFLEKDKLDLPEIKNIVADVEREQNRAVEILNTLRTTIKEI
ncbi:MAG: hypothetical protein HQL26_08210 [Candidatus Omnitrophica bacterium]|nr:hypothetical protein [Candidatus Omnitrophota bacterium]